MYEIRMKPGCGRALIGRKWEVKGELTDVRPEGNADLVNSLDEWLEARKEEQEGVWSEGPTAIVSEDRLRKLLGSDGKPSRVIEGYAMTRIKGGKGQDQSGATVDVRDQFFPGQQPGVSNDATFEIVRKVS